MSDAAARAVGPPADGSDAAGSALAQRLVALTRSLREHGVPAGTSEIADAARVAQVLGLHDRELLREGLAAALVRRPGQREVFDRLFDVYLPAATGSRTAVDQEDSPGPDADGATDAREVAAGLREQLVRTLAEHDRARLEQLAALALERLGRVPNAPGFSAAQALDALAPQTAIAAAARLAARRPADGEGGAAGSGQGGASGSGGGSGAPGGPSDEALRQEIRREVAHLRRAVETEARRRNAEVRGREQIARYVEGTLEQRDLTGPGSRELAEMRSVIDPLARKLAARLASRRRQHSRGAVDLRRTLRASLSTGGVPLDPVMVHRRPHKPDLVLLCDISGSVAGFSAFTMALMQALSTQFRRLRVFAFVSTTDEITDLVRAADRLPQDVVTTALRTRNVLGWGASSSYGQALDSFVADHLGAIGPRSTVLVLGDARSNYGLPRLESLRTVVRAARQVIWLNPEPAASWDTGDSLAGQYARLVDMHECRTIDQLRTFVARSLTA